MGLSGEPGLSLAYMILGKPLPSLASAVRGLDFPTQQCVGQETIGSFEDPASPVPHREGAAQASGQHFRL